MDSQTMRRLVDTARVGRLATADAQGRPHAVPVCHARRGETVYSAVDRKPKRHPRLRRLANVAENPAVSLLVDAYQEDWSALWWVRLDGRGRMVGDPAEAAAAAAALAEKYPQYAEEAPTGPVLALDIDRWRGWAAAPDRLPPAEPQAEGSAESLVDLLELSPHPEGGWFRETWRSPLRVDPPGYPGTRAAATAIYFLLHPGEWSRWHVVRSAEVWLWHRGGPLTLRLGGAGDRPAPAQEVTLGPDLAGGARPQVVVPAGVWQSAVPAGTAPVLVSCVVAPGFEMADFRLL